MFSKLKIFSAISLIIGMFAVLLLGTTSYSVINAISNNGNFKRVLVASDNNDQMRDAVYNISEIGRAHV